MTTIKRCIITILLSVLLVSCLAGCTIANPSLLNEKVVAMIDYTVQQDTENGYAMLYPGVSDADTYRSTAKQIYEYFPVTAGYTWELQQWHITQGINNSASVYEGQYKVEFDGKLFYVIAIWRSDSDEEGFTRFQVASEEDWNAANSK